MLQNRGSRMRSMTIPVQPRRYFGGELVPAESLHCRPSRRSLITEPHLPLFFCQSQATATVAAKAASSGWRKALWTVMASANFFFPQVIATCPALPEQAPVQRRPHSPLTRCDCMKACQNESMMQKRASPDELLRTRLALRLH